MFTGLIEELGVVGRVERAGDGGRLFIRAHEVLDGTRLGDSMAVNGACLTVIGLGRDGFTVDCMPETFSRTTLGKAEVGTWVNLERTLVVGSRLGGHLVLGHVDAVAQVLAIERRGDSCEVRVSLSDDIRPYVAPKGSIAVDGISLTVMKVEDEEFDVGIIPYTLKGTTMRSARTGLAVNLEVDVVARYLGRLLQVQAGSDGHPGAQQGLTEELLREKGFE